MKRFVLSLVIALMTISLFGANGINLRNYQLNSQQALALVSSSSYQESNGSVSSAYKTGNALMWTGIGMICGGTVWFGGLLIYIATTVTEDVDFSQAMINCFQATLFSAYAIPILVGGGVVLSIVGGIVRAGARQALNVNIPTNDIFPGSYASLGMTDHGVGMTFKF